MKQRANPPRSRRWTVGALMGVLVLTGVLAGSGVGAGGLPHARAQSSPHQCDPDEPQLVTQRPPAFDALGIDAAHRYSRGEGVSVAVVDSGVHSGNEHLSGVVVDGVNVVDNDGPYDEDVDSHGTFVAGIIAAREVEGSAVLGVAPEAQIHSARVFYADAEQAEREDTHPTPARIAAGIEWAAHSGAQIINVSMNTTVDDPRLREAVAEAVDRGALVVASAGNRDTTQVQDPVSRYPAAYEGVLGVSGVDRAGVWHADASFETPDVDVVAPGQHVPSAFLDAGDCLFSGDQAAPSSSWATAYVAGAAALIAAKYPDETAEQWSHRLQVTATRAGTWERDDQVGWGMIQPVAALQFLDDGTSPGPPSPVHGPAQPYPEPSLELDMVHYPDPLAPAQEMTRWWLIGSAALIVLALLYSRTRRPA